MEESFRRAIRKMTGKSISRFSMPLDRNACEEKFSASMTVNWAIALFEHLNAVYSSLDSENGSQDLVSYSAKAWAFSESEFPKLIAESKTRFEEFRKKWEQRFSSEELHRMLLQGEWIKESEQGYFLAVNKNKTDINNFYLATIHLMVGDAEKLFVMLTSKILRLQDRLCKFWYEESALDAISKILPCLEASFRKEEDRFVSELRTTISKVAREHFNAAFAGKIKTKYFSTSLSCARGIGRFWNPAFAYENSFLGFLEDFCDYASGLSLLIEEWYFEKWSLFLRGFSRGQLDLFAPLQQPMDTYE